MPVLTDSRMGPGVLKLGTVDHGTQISNVRLVPERDSEDGTKTLGIPKPGPIGSTSWSLQGTAVQDWEHVDGFVEFCRLNDWKEVPFTWTPNNGKGTTFAGTCQVAAVEFGGDVDTQNTTDFEFPIVGDYTRSETAPTTLAHTK